jgi:hypothetical protein
MKLARALLAAAALACGTDNGNAKPPAGAGAGGDAARCPDAAACTFVDAHDRVRANATPAPKPPLEPLRWSAEVAATARRWADRCVYEHDPALEAAKQGQNLFASTDVRTPQAAVDAWASEAGDYDLAANRCAAGKACGHYTQLVWRGTREVGCAARSCTRGSPFPGRSAWWLVVCNYAPPGNWVGQKPY